MLWVPDVGFLASLWLNQKKKNSPLEANMNRFEHLEEQMVPMRAWRLAGAPECGHWVHVGRMKEIYNCVDRPMSFGSPRSVREPVVLLLQTGHYTSWLNAKQANSGQKLGQALKRPN